MKSKKIESVAQKVLQIPKDVAMDISKIVLNGDGELFLGNYKGILEFGERQIKVNAAGRIVGIEGENLSIKTIENDEIVVLGQITAVRFL